MTNDKISKIKEIVCFLKQDREEIALKISESSDYYSFLEGFDYVLNVISYELNN